MRRLVALILVIGAATAECTASTDDGARRGDDAGKDAGGTKDVSEEDAADAGADGPAGDATDATMDADGPSADASDGTAATDGPFSTFCAGTSIAGTCAQSYFGAAWACFSPSGTCHSAGNIYSDSTYCWADGASLHTTAGGTAGNPFKWLHDGQSCLSSSEEWFGGFYSPNGGVTYWPGSGDLQCPDGAQVNVGADFGGCQALRQLLSVPTQTECPPGVCDGVDGSGDL